ncbi:hypothetical protein DL765_000112 [Monosporascus sp. GIB2]|nr:hypothetical protein DL765_000112 [Monosporascus sp. GIB2]
MATVARLYSRIWTALLASRGSRFCISGMDRFTPGGLRRYGEYPNRNVQLLPLGQRYLRYTRPCGKNNEELNRRWKSWSQRREQVSSSIEPGHIFALIARELGRRGDFREPGELSDPEFNELYLDAMSGALDGVGHTTPRVCTPQPSIEEQINPRFFRPHIYHSQSSTWAAFYNSVEALRRGNVLKIASWNLSFSSPGAGARAVAALAYLRTMFGQEPHNLVVMLQELRQESLEAILDDKWTQQNFVLSDVKPPDAKPLDCLYEDGESSDLEDTDWRPSPYFTLMMVSRTLPISNCFRVPFPSKMWRDALVVDIPVLDDRGPEQPKESLRLCTTHLESLYTRKEYRFRQLAMISALLKGASSQGKRIRGGLVGGDMNPSDPSEHGYHREPEVGLKDVWEDEPAPTPPVLKPFQKDTTYGRARGNTWGYQSDKARTRKRLDKFLYTGSIETLAVDEAQDVTGKLGRFGIGLKTNIGMDVWVSDHFGITVGIRIV